MPAQATLDQVNALATHTALSAYAVVGNVLVLLILAGALFLFAWYVGRGPFVALLLALYAAYAIYVVFPYTALFPAAPPLSAFVAKGGLYLVLALLFYIILRRVAVSDFLYVGIFGLIGLSFLGAAFLIALSYHAFAVGSVYHFSDTIAALFAPAKFFFWWFVAPAVGLFVLAR